MRHELAASGAGSQASLSYKPRCSALSGATLAGQQRWRVQAVDIAVWQPLPAFPAFCRVRHVLRAFVEGLAGPFGMGYCAGTRRAVPATPLQQQPPAIPPPISALPNLHSRLPWTVSVASECECWQWVGPLEHGLAWSGGRRHCRQVPAVHEWDSAALRDGRPSCAARHAVPLLPVRSTATSIRQQGGLE